jgi:UPF0755 protein
LSVKINKNKNVFFSILKIISLLIILSLTVLLLSLGIIMYYNSPVPTEKMPVITDDMYGIKKTEDNVYIMDVRRGETSQAVGTRLESSGLIRSRYFWNLLCRFKKEQIKTGTYRIEPPVNMIAVHDLLVSGKQILYRVTIPEGVTLSKIAVILEEAGICSAQDFLESAKDPQIINQYQIPNKSMEGYLFFFIYLFPAEYPPAQIINAMVENFYNRLENINPLSAELSPKELNDIVILASIVEREYRLAEEAPLMAGVFHNRLRINMGLQSCATVEYIITEIQGKPHPAVIYNQDLEIRDPYNTYMWAGLPPGPISTPGSVALRAVMFPQETEYLYFRLDDPVTGNHYFSKTLDEHIKAGQLLTKRQS